MNITKLGTALGVLAMAVSTLITQAAEPPGVKRVFNIGPQSTETALTEFGLATGMQVLFATEMTAEQVSPAVVGELTAQEALEKILGGTGLRAEFVNERTVTIRDARDKTTVESTDRDASAGSLRRIQLAQRDTSRGGPGQSADTQQASALEEVIVTANRREQSAQDVASAIQVFAGEELDRLGADGFEDYMATVPGASFREQGSGSTRIALRGISNAIGSDFGTTTSSTPVGVYLDDVPISATSVLPNLALYDLQRIEVLKGPQGTLYGEGAMGGAIKMISQPPNAQRVEAKGDLTLSGTESGGLNQRVRGAVNVPLGSDRVALRVVGTGRRDEGYIDNVNALRSETNHNDEEAYSIRGGLSAQLTERFSARVLALYDVAQQDDFSDVEVDKGDLKIDSAEDRFNEVKSSIYGLTLTYDLDDVAELTAVSSHVSSTRDVVPRFEFASIFVPGAINEEPIEAVIDTQSVAQELRLVSHGDKRLDWVMGAFYRDTEVDGDFGVTLNPVDFTAANTILAPAARFAEPLVYHELVTETVEQLAAYGEVTLEIVDRLDLAVGLRWYREERTFDRDVAAGGPLRVLAGSIAQVVDDDGVVPKVALSYKLSAGHLLYALAAKGFRSSVINNMQTLIGDAGAVSDNIWSYELGAKTEWLGRRLSVNGTLFYVDWSDIQLNLSGISPVTGRLTGYKDNGGDAEILGVELDVLARPTEHVSLGLGVGYNHSEMVRVTDLGVIPGQPLPNSPQWTVSAFGEYRFPFFAWGDGFVRADVQLVDDQLSRPAVLAEPDGRPLESYSLGALRIGVQRDQWSVSVFADNLWNERAQTGRGLVLGSSAQRPDRYTVVRPRTIGLSIGRSW